jgi:spectinomycin phosphotransferase
MREPPPLAEGTIVAALRDEFGIGVAALEFLPVGNDAASWAFRVEAPPAPPLFLKVRAGAGAMTGAAVPDHLARQGVPLVLGPRPTRAGLPFALVDRFALALYPLLEARTGAEVGLSRAQWQELGAAMARVHAVALAPLAGLVGRETFRPSRRELIPELQALLATPADPVAAELATCWREHQATIDTLVEQADRLGHDAGRAPSRQVLSHGDLHTWNVLVDSDRRLWIVDWDEAALAPRERDLFFVVGGIRQGLVGPEETDSFLRGYGQTAIDPLLVSYYRTAWAVQDIAAYGEQALLAPDVGEASRRDAVAGFRSLFAPGSIVDLALA